LVVEDDDDVRESVGELVLERGLLLEAFPDGGPALAYLREGGAADLIFLDLRMPNVDGWKFASELRRIRGHQQTPVVVMTGADVLPRAPVSAAYLEKPMARDAILDAIDRCLG
jgi:CheY-like chemotaxis protein